MQPTYLVYSAHDRCEHLHRDLIVQRALESWDNKTIFYLPFSSGDPSGQEGSWNGFSWYFDGFRPFGLVPSTFIWTDRLGREDVELCFTRLRESEVVVLGGGRTDTGLERYRALGEWFFGNPDAFQETLRDREVRGKLTAGFSAGADQLGEHTCDSAPVRTFGLVRQVCTVLHFGPGSEGHVQYLARKHPDCLCFGLPNDSGLAVNQGWTPRGTFWQLIEFVLDTTWDRPEDQWHIKTRQGVKIEHRYADGRDWQFNHGDVMLRVVYPDGMTQAAWIKQPHRETWVEYGSQWETGFRTWEEILWER